MKSQPAPTMSSGSRRLVQIENACGEPVSLALLIWTTDFRVGRSDRRIRGLSGYRAHCDQKANKARTARTQLPNGGPARPLNALSRREITIRQTFFAA